MDDNNMMAIRSFRACFRIERRIHKIDRWRIPVPFGVPLRGVAYAAAAAIAIVLLSRFPVVGAVVRQLHPALRFVALPTAAAYALTRWEIDGRSPHAAGRSWLRMLVRPRRVASCRPAAAYERALLAAVTVAPDERGARLRRGRVTGPANVLVRYPFRARQTRRTLHLRPEPGAARWRGKQITLKPGQRMTIG